MERLALGFNPVLPLTKMVQLAQRAEALGYESVWLHESLYQRDAISYLATLLGNTKELKVASGCINTVTRHPTLTACSFATLAEAYEGRAILGIGLGSFPTLPKIGYRVFPTSESKTLRRIREYITIVRRLLDGEELDFSGRFFTVKGLRLEVRPRQRVPIYLASLSPKTLAQAPKLADGALLSPALSTVEETRMKVGWLGEGLRHEFDVASYLLTSVHEEEREAERAVRTFYFFVYQLADVIKPSLLEPYGVKEEELLPVREAWRKGDVKEAGARIPREAIDALTLTGTPEHCRRRMEEYRKAGVKLPILMPIGEIDKSMEALAPS